MIRNKVWNHRRLCTIATQTTKQMHYALLYYNKSFFFQQTINAAGKGNSLKQKIEIDNDLLFNISSHLCF